MEAHQLAVWGIGDTPRSALGVSDAAIGLGLGEASGLLCALVRGDQDQLGAPSIRQVSAAASLWPGVEACTFASSRSSSKEFPL